MSRSNRKCKNQENIDRWLEDLGYYRKNIPWDETCVFRAISEQLYGCQIYHERVRKEYVSYARINYEKFCYLFKNKEEWNHKLDMIENHMTFCSTNELIIIGDIYKRDVLVFNGSTREIKNVTYQNHNESLMLCSMGKDHYDVIYKMEHIQNAGFCQSVVYKILYENVFGLENVDEIVNNMLCTKEFKTENVENVFPCPFPYKVAKALDPTIYRNIEYDAWVESRKELRLSQWYHGDNRLILGTKCIYKEPECHENLECYIQKIDGDKCTVFITKFAEMKLVNYADLSPENDAKPWPLPLRYLKYQRTSGKQQKEKKFRNDKKANNKGKVKVNNSDVNNYTGVPLHMETPSPEVNEPEHDWPQYMQVSAYTDVFDVDVETPPSNASPPEFFLMNYPVEQIPEEQYNNAVPQEMYNLIPAEEESVAPFQQTHSRPHLTLNISAPNPSAEMYPSPGMSLQGQSIMYTSTPTMEMSPFPPFIYPPPVNTTQFVFPPTPPVTWFTPSTPTTPWFPPLPLFPPQE